MIQDGFCEIWQTSSRPYLALSCSMGFGLCKLVSSFLRFAFWFELCLTSHMNYSAFFRRTDLPDPMNLSRSFFPQQYSCCCCQPFSGTISRISYRWVILLPAFWKRSHHVTCVCFLEESKSAVQNLIDLASIFCVFELFHLSSFYLSGQV